MDHYDVGANTHLKEQNSEQMWPPDNLERSPPNGRPRVAVLGHARSCDSDECLNAVAEPLRLPRRDGF